MRTSSGIDVKITAVDFKHKVKNQEVVRSITTLLDEFKDVFPNNLPDGLPTSRRVEFDLIMKPDAIPINRAPFLLSKVERDAHDMFVAGKLKKDYAEQFQHPDSLNVKAEGLLHFKSQMMMLVCVPNTKDNYLWTTIIACFHDFNIAAHPGSQRTFSSIAKWYDWHILNQDVRDYVRGCEKCTRWKHSKTHKNGTIIPIPIPEECWSVISMDFITGLSKSNGFDAIMTGVDKLFKRSKNRVCNRDDDAHMKACHFFDCVVGHHGLSSIIISDRDSKFVSKFWSSLAKLIGICLHMTTSYGAQADGQTERQNLILEDALCCMISYYGRDWSDYLGKVEYAHANLVSASTGMSPFEIDAGRKERNSTNPRSTRSVTAQVQHGIAVYAKHYESRRQESIDLATKHLLQAQDRHKKNFEKNALILLLKLVIWSCWIPVAFLRNMRHNTLEENAPN
ncbi:unnamed protein product [Albugo candida]|uniref:Integrase catalytic domain-containing protein n=1 Tax=Albugo candida TaxID=65357 RepID=A0A024FVV3_9STRA|nr:unnamed protein product [Albugo candida]|eukprot:CCI10794.1 unnamed protein product [Albugo candida]